MPISMELKAEFNHLCFQLFPENLSQDGELDPADVVTRRNQLKAKWEELEKKAGRTVTQSEAAGWTDELNAWVTGNEIARFAAFPKHPRLQLRPNGLWHSVASSGNTRYYVVHAGWMNSLIDPSANFCDEFRVYAPIASIVGGPEPLGAYDSLPKCVQKGEEFIRSITFDLIKDNQPTWTDPMVERELRRLK